MEFDMKDTGRLHTTHHPELLKLESPPDMGAARGFCLIPNKEQQIKL